MLKLTEQATKLEWVKLNSHTWFLETYYFILAMADQYYYTIFSRYHVPEITIWLPEGSKGNVELNKQLAEEKLRELGIIE